ncbi:MAG: MBL fold metallo-hydrolase [Actinomycetota bacterium]|jgi:ribonuclease J|nr:MBL fold metallo-hydrolase [Actinomycetota bacterium]
MALLSFYGGVGRIGSTKVLVEQDGWRVFLDLGLLVPDQHQLLQPSLQLRPGAELATRLRLGEAPRIPRLYRAGALEGLDLEGGTDGRTALFISHCHIDHMGLIGWVDPGVPIYAAPESVRMVEALEAAGLGPEGGAPRLLPMAEDEVVEVGPLRVERVTVDHDVPGASAYLVHTDEGIVAYSGDIRLHGRHPERTMRFASRAAGASALVIEGTSLSGDPAHVPSSEASVDEAYDKVLSATPGLVLQTLYSRDTERVRAFTEMAAGHGRQVLWPAPVAKFLSAYGLQGVRALDDEAIAEARSSPESFAVQIAVAELDRLLELPLGPGSVFVHANGEPLGPFHQPGWDLLQAWLRHLHVPWYSVGTTGHATPADIDQVVEVVSPETVYPVHTLEPYRLTPPPGTRRALPEYGRRYRVDPEKPHSLSLTAASRSGTAAPRPTVCVDLDSTLADTRQRHHMVLPGDQRDNTDWVAYSLACGADDPIEGTCQLVRILSADHRIVVLSRRDEAARDLTTLWLERHGVPFDELILGGVDGTPADQHEFKVHHLRALADRGEKVVLMVDDLPGLDVAVADAGLGVPVLRVQSPYSLQG